MLAVGYRIFGDVSSLEISMRQRTVNVLRRSKEESRGQPDAKNCEDGSNGPLRSCNFQIATDRKMRKQLGVFVLWNIRYFLHLLPSTHLCESNRNRSCPTHACFWPRFLEVHPTSRRQVCKKFAVPGCIVGTSSVLVATSPWCLPWQQKIQWFKMVESWKGWWFAQWVANTETMQRGASLDCGMSVPPAGRRCCKDSWGSKPVDLHMDPTCLLLLSWMIMVPHWTFCGRMRFGL